MQHLGKIPLAELLTWAAPNGARALGFSELGAVSYTHLVAGLITSRRTGEKLRPIAQGEPYEIDEMCIRDRFLSAIYCNAGSTSGVQVT